MVFLNACNSARPVIDRSMGDTSNWNFAEVFLRQNASGVVASMAEVPIGHSAPMARNLVGEARADGVRIPEYLRDHRARYAKNRQIQSGPYRAATAKYRSLIYASVFAYFGHPESVFRLAEP